MPANARAQPSLVEGWGRAYGGLVRCGTALLLVVGIGVGACARDDARWPSLKPRPAELRGLQTMRDGDPGRVPNAPSPRSIDPSAVAARLMAAEAERAKARHGLSIEQAAMTSALAAAQGSARDSDASAAAQLQLTRIETIHARLDDLQSDVDRLLRDAETSDPATRARANVLAAGLRTNRATLSRITQAARDALAR